MDDARNSGVGDIMPSRWGGSAPVERAELPFAARLFAVTQNVAGQWIYSWQEAVIEPATGALQYLDGHGRFGTLEGSGNGPAFEVNNQLVAVPCFVILRPRGWWNGALVCDFNAPPVASLTLTGQVTQQQGGQVTFGPGETIYFVGSGGGSINYGTGGGTGYPAPPINVLQPTVLTVSPGMTYTVAGGGNVDYSGLGGTFSQPPIQSIPANTTLTVSPGKTYTLTGATGTIDATGLGTVKLPSGTLIGGGTPVTGTGTNGDFPVYTGTGTTVGNSILSQVATGIIIGTTGISLTSGTNNQLTIGNATTGNGLSLVYDDLHKKFLVDDTSHDATLWLNGTQLAGASGITPAALPTLDLIPTAAADVALGSHKLTGLANGTATTDAATFGQLTSLAVNGTAWKSPVLLLSHSNITLSGEQTIDGVLTSASRVAVVAQTTASQNGLYTTAAGVWTRTADLASGVGAANVAFFVEEGTVYADTAWVCTTNPGSDVVGTNSLAFTQFGTGTSYSAGTGLTLTGTTFSVGAGQIANSMLAAGTTGTGGAVVLATSPTLATPTMTNVTVSQIVNGDVMIGGRRKTDTSPTGSFEEFEDTTGVDLWRVDTTGTLVAGIVPAARVGTGYPGSSVTSGYQASGLAGTQVDAHLSANQSLTQNAWNTLHLDTEDTDSLSEYNPTTYTFTPGTTGVYLVAFYWTSTAAPVDMYARLATSGGTEIKRFNGGTQTTAGGTIPVTLTGGTGYVFQAFTGTAAQSAVSGAGFTFISIRRFF